MNHRYTLLSLLLLLIPLMGNPAMAADETTPMAQPGTDAAPPPATAAQGSIARAVFTTGINDREPVDQVTSLPTDKDKIYFFTEVRGMPGQTVKHRWEYNGKTMAEVEFHIGGPRWRVWSNKTLLPQWTGEWKVSVVDESGNVLSESTFTYSEAKM
jgi:hypothetical protein